MMGRFFVRQTCLSIFSLSVQGRVSTCRLTLRTIMIVSAVDPQLRKNNRINDRLLSITAPDLADIRLVE